MAAAGLAESLTATVQWHTCTLHCVLGQDLSDVSGTGFIKKCRSLGPLCQIRKHIAAPLVKSDLSNRACQNRGDPRAPTAYSRTIRPCALWADSRPGI